MSKTYFDMGKNKQKRAWDMELLPIPEASKNAIAFFKALERARIDLLRGCTPPPPKDKDQ